MSEKILNIAHIRNFDDLNRFMQDEYNISKSDWNVIQRHLGYLHALRMDAKRKAQEAATSGALGTNKNNNINPIKDGQSNYETYKSRSQQ